MGGDLEEVVVSDGDYVLVFLGWVSDRVIGRLGGDSRGVEHVLVGGHGHRLLSHVLWF